MKIVKGNNRIEKTLEIDLPSGETALALNVSLSTQDLEKNVIKAYEQLSISQAELQKNPASVEAYGKAVVAFYEAIFGADQTAQLLALYESNYTEMLLDTVPFIQEEIMPELKRITDATKAKLVAQAKAQKRPFIKWMK
ncbi:MAG: hypothetical protein J6S50_02300 [Oscillospiraceae bacterium]|nr:hypothetical protein [Oscillospiraceae bacterium]